MISALCTVAFSDDKTFLRLVAQVGLPSPVSMRILWRPRPIRYVFVPGAINQFSVLEDIYKDVIRLAL